jgi:two-component system, NtrC family, response regulator AtoC
LSDASPIGDNRFVGDADDLSKTKTLPPAAAPPSAVDDRFYVLVLQGGSSSLFHLPRNGTILFGRAPEVDVPIADESASRHHARIITADGEARVHDLDSHNGTFVNGERITSTRLDEGDEITIGRTHAVFRPGKR